MRRRLSATCIVGVLLAATAPVAAAGEVLVAVAANFAGALEAIGAEFSEVTGHTIQVTTGSTGKLHAQISEGAPFQVLLSADAATPAKLEEEGNAVTGTRFTYAVGRLSLWSADPDRSGDDPTAALTAADTLYVAIANPDLAPYGVASRETLTSMGLWEEVQPKIVMGENIGQTFSMVDTGAAQVGFIATSAVLIPGEEPRGSRYDVPQGMFNPIRQVAVLLKPGESSAAAAAFLDYLKGDGAIAIAQSYGYGTE